VQPAPLGEQKIIMEPALRELIEISHAAGNDEDLVQAGGGNTSVKTERGTMLIKASGTTLGGMAEDRGWVELDLAAVHQVMNDPALAAMPDQAREAALVEGLARTRLAGPGERPSVETVVHALLGRVVIHTHAVAVNAIGCAEASEANFGAFVDDLLWVPYCDPGWPLAKVIQRRLAEMDRSEPATAPAVLIQENHGIFVHGETPEAAQEMHRECIEACLKRAPIEVADSGAPDPAAVRPIALAIRQAHARLSTGEAPPIECHTGPVVHASRRPELHHCALNDEAATRLAEGALTPDHIVYCGPESVRIPSGADTEAVFQACSEFQSRNRIFPKLAVAEGVGTFVIGQSPKHVAAADSVAASVVRTLQATQAAGHATRYMPRRDVDYILNWEEEHYRAKQMSGASARPLEGRIAMVTGAGSGLGRWNAWGMAKAGALVCFTDIDLPAAEEAQARLGDEFAGRVLALHMDVTDEDSVRTAFDQCVAHFGGLDILMNCAGIAPPYNLVDFPVDLWRKALEINLTGYFLPSREAARVMQAQRTGGAIVCLTSKSGLEASKANSAYNATKAGEIHLARGWALELAPDLIRVNCIAPGNVFEGSKIWNPEYIKKAAEKKGIAPEDVIPHYVALSPLNKEIKGQDVADAAIFLASDHSRRMTGQVMVIDGGQVMVR